MNAFYRFLKGFAIGSVIGLTLVLGINYARAADSVSAPREDCVGTVTQLLENIQRNPTGKITPISPEETSAILAKKGKPPVTEPFTFSLASTSELGMIIIHDGDCIMLPIGPAPIEQINTFLGRVEANL